MLLRKHPDATWTRPYENVELDISHYVPAGDFVGLQDSTNDVIIELSNSSLRIRFISADIVRITLGVLGNVDNKFPKDDLHLDENGPYGIIRYEGAPVPHSISNENDRIIITTEKLRVFIAKKPFSLSVLNSKGVVLLSTLENGIMLSDVAQHRETIVQFDLRPNDHFWGIRRSNCQN